MASDRGAYRAISVVLLDGKDFHRLGKDDRWVFVAMKLTFGPSGIEVHYPRALAEQLAEQTGIDADDVIASMQRLEADGWIRREGNIVWITRQLEFEPNMKPSDIKHRKSIQRHVLGLPSLPIVAAFIAQYAEWFPADEFTPPKGLESPSEGSEKGLARAIEVPKTDNREPITEKKTEKKTPAAHRSNRDDLFAKLWQLWPKKQARIAAQQKFEQRMKEGVAFDEITAGVERYLACKAAGNGGTVDSRYVHNLGTFLGPQRLWRESWDPPEAPPHPNGKHDEEQEFVDWLTKDMK